MRGFYSICFGLVLAYLAFGGARSLLKKDTPKPNSSLVYKPSEVKPTTTATEKRRYSF